MSEGERLTIAPPIEEVEASVERRRAARVVRERVAAVLAPIVVIVALLALWEAGTRLFAVPLFLLPPPSAIVAAMAKNVALLAAGAWVTTLEIVLGFLLSIAVGIPLALMIFLWPPFARTVMPLLVYVAKSPALLPPLTSAYCRMLP